MRGRTDASPEDVERVYRDEMLSVRGQLDMQHYEGRLEIVLGNAGYPIALEILTAAAVLGRLNDEGIDAYRAHFSARADGDRAGVPSVDNVLHVLVHDGYLERQEDGYRFVSKLLEDWWRNRYGRNFEPAVKGQPLSGDTRR